MPLQRNCCSDSNLCRAGAGSDVHGGCITSSGGSGGAARGADSGGCADCVPTRDACERTNACKRAPNAVRMANGEVSKGKSMSRSQLKFSTQQCWRRGRAVAETAPATEELMPGPVYAQEP